MNGAWKVLLVASLFLVLQACKKQNSTGIAGNTVATARLSKVVLQMQGGQTETYDIAYNADNTVDSMLISFIPVPGTGARRVRKFVYHNGYYEVISRDSPFMGTQSVDYIVVLTKNGKISSVNSWSDTLTVTYNPFNQMTSTREYIIGQYIENIYYGPSVTTWHYQWDANGNIGSYSADNSGSVAYDYDLSKQGQTGDLLRIDEFLQYGRCIHNSANVTIGWHQDVNPAVNPFTLSYSYDSLGRITQATSPNNYYPETYTYEYY